MTLARVALIAAFTTLVWGVAASAQDAGASESPPTEAAPAQGDAKTELTDEERAQEGQKRFAEPHGATAVI